MKSLILILALGIFTPVFGAPKTKCFQHRAGIDVGSGTTKMKVIKVDICRKKVLSVVLERRTPVALKENSTKDKGLSLEIQKKLINVLKGYLADLKPYKIKNVKAVATSAFRTAKNGKAVAKKIVKQLGINFKVIDQNEEARLGYVAGRAHAKNPQGKVVVWDIGGGSYQFVTMKGKELVISGGQMGAVPFKNLIIEKIQRRPVAKVKTPNPINEDQLLKASLFAALEARSKVNSYLKKLLEDKETEVVGIGGVHSYSIKDQVKPKGEVVELEALRKVMTSRAGLTDKQIESKYVNTEISNLGLVYGMMEGLLINKVKVAKVNLADALCVDGL